MSFTHLDESGRARMVDVSAKNSTRRRARAVGEIFMAGETLNGIRQHGHKKGDVLAVARIAGILAAKKVADLVPLCHPIALTSVEVGFELLDGNGEESARVRCTAEVLTVAPTGVEIEALQAVQSALLCIYDMCKAVDPGMCMQGIRLLAKEGGRSGSYQAPDL